MCLENISVDVRPQKTLESLINESLSHPEVKRAKEQTASADARLTATKRQYLPTVSAIASGGTFDPFDPRQNQQTGGWWMAGALVSMPLFTGFLIENQVVEATANREAASAATQQHRTGADSTGHQRLPRYPHVRPTNQIGGRTGQDCRRSVTALEAAVQIGAGNGGGSDPVGGGGHGGANALG